MNPATTYHSVAASVQSWIHSGELHPGTQLPSERSLCERLGVSRVNARDALHLLEGQGLIYRLNRIGWFVAPLHLSMTQLGPTASLRKPELIIERSIPN